MSTVYGMFNFIGAFQHEGRTFSWSTLQFKRNTALVHSIRDSMKNILIGKNVWVCCIFNWSALCRYIQCWVGLEIFEWETILHSRAWIVCHGGCTVFILDWSVCADRLVWTSCYFFKYTEIKMSDSPFQKIWKEIFPKHWSLNKNWNVIGSKSKWLKSESNN